MTILTKLVKADFEKILSNYCIGEFHSARHSSQALETTVYFIRTSKGKYVLKIFEGQYRDHSRFEIKIQALASDKKIATPKLIKTRTGTTYITYKKKTMFLQDFFEGNYPVKFTNEEISALGIDLAKMHLALSEISGKREGYGPFATEITSTIPEIDLTGEFKKTIASIKKLELSKLKEGVIHGDVQASNMLRSRENKIVLIDWGDAHYGFYAAESAIFIAHMLIKIKLVYWNQIKLLLQAYQSRIKLNLEEKKAIYYFIKLRILGAVDWCIEQCRRHPNLEKSIKKWMREQIKHYQLFSKITLEEFLSKI